MRLMFLINRPASFAIDGLYGHLSLRLNPMLNSMLSGRALLSYELKNRRSFFLDFDHRAPGQT